LLWGIVHLHLALVCCPSGDIGAHSAEIKRLPNVAVNTTHIGILRKISLLSDPPPEAGLYGARPLATSRLAR
jgi:hypothetical protein